MQDMYTKYRKLMCLLAQYKDIGIDIYQPTDINKVIYTPVCFWVLQYDKDR